MIPYGYKQTEVGVIPEDWSVSALEKLYNITSSKRVFQSQWRKSGVPFYRAREIAVMSEGKIAPEDLYIDESLYNQYIHQYGSINKNDILITGVGTLGKVYVVKENDRFYFKDGNIIWLQAKHDFSSIYLKYQYDMPALINQVFGNAGGSTVATYTITNAKTTKVPVPPLPEQQRIAEALSDVDGMISSLEKLVAKYKSIKTACLQQMFPQNGETVPRMRLPGFTGVWEQRKLSEMCGTFEYGLNAAAKEFDGKNKYIRITDIDDASREFLLSDLSSPDICLDGMSKYLLSSGDIVFARTGASVGKTYIYRENDGIVYFAGFLIRAKVNQDNDAEFVFQSTLSPSYEKYIRITSQRSGQPGVNAQEYSECDLFAPSKEEQQRIGHFLRGVDNLITLHQRKLEKIQKIKQGMMQQLLTGKIRLV